jgi:hypothetical protein
MLLLKSLVKMQPKQVQNANTQASKVAEEKPSSVHRSKPLMRRLFRDDDGVVAFIDVHSSFLQSSFNLLPPTVIVLFRPAVKVRYGRRGDASEPDLPH